MHQLEAALKRLRPRAEQAARERKMKSAEPSAGSGTTDLTEQTIRSWGFRVKSKTKQDRVMKAVSRLSVYYDKNMNPRGAPPPGKVQAYRHPDGTIRPEPPRQLVEEIIGSDASSSSSSSSSYSRGSGSSSSDSSGDSSGDSDDDGSSSSSEGEVVRSGAAPLRSNPAPNMLNIHGGRGGPAPPPLMPFLQPSAKAVPATQLNLTTLPGAGEGAHPLQRAAARPQVYHEHPAVRGVVSHDPPAPSRPAPTFRFVPKQAKNGSVMSQQVKRNVENLDQEVADFLKDLD